MVNNLQELLRIVTDDELIPLMLAIEAPSIKSSYNKGTTPEVYILLSNDPMCPSNHCGMLVSIRQDVYENIDQAIVEDVMMKLSQWLKAHTNCYTARVTFMLAVKHALSWILFHLCSNRILRI